MPFIVAGKSSPLFEHGASSLVGMPNRLTLKMAGVDLAAGHSKGPLSVFVVPDATGA